MNTQLPAPLGLKKSFGFGDRLGLAPPGHFAAARKFDFAPIFAQQSIREMERTQRTPQEVMKAAAAALGELGYTKPWGADADHLKLPEHVDRTAGAGFCFLTIDSFAHVGKGKLTSDLEAFYVGKKFDMPGLRAVKFDRPSVQTAAVKYAAALEHVGVMGRQITKAMGARPFEIEVSVDETEEPMSVLEHLFIGMELKRRKVPSVVSVALRFMVCRGRFDTDRASYHISATVEQVCVLPPYRSAKDEPIFLDEGVGRQLLHVTFGSVLTHPNFKPRILETLQKHADLHLELLDRYLTKPLSLLSKG